MLRFFLLSVLCLVFLAAGLPAQTTDGLLRELLDLPAPAPLADESTENKPGRYVDGNPPPDDAPLEDLLDYWKRKSAEVYTSDSRQPKISPASAGRLLDQLAERPEDLAEFINVLPNDAETAERVKSIFDAAREEAAGDDWRQPVKNWLKFNSKFYLDELEAEAAGARDLVRYGSVAKREELLALARLDWERAVAILRRLAGDAIHPRTAALAKALLYKKALETGDKTEIEKYRAELKKMLADRTLPASMRDTAADALFETGWPGQDDYYLSLMEDETLLFPKEGYQLYTPLTTLTAKDPDKWVPIMTKLIGHGNRAVHNAAVQSLINLENRKDALEPLLPWLSDPDWADIPWNPGGRITFMQIVSNFDLPASVPGLIWIIENEDANAHWAARSLAKFKDPSAVPALREALLRIGAENSRQEIIRALIACQGLTDDEQMTALEFYAEFITKPENARKSIYRNPFGDENPLPAAVSIGHFLAEQPEPGEGLVVRLIERQRALLKEKPAVAKILSGIMAKWKGRLIDLELLDRIAAGRADAETIVGALTRRKQLRASILNEIYALRGKAGLPGAVAACLLDEEAELVSAFRSAEAETQVAALACARLLRVRLPVPEVGAMLGSRNQLLALAAERYLESEDSSEARELIFARHPNEVLILGARGSFNPAKKELTPAIERLFASVIPRYGSFLTPDASSYASFDQFEDRLRAEIRADPELLEIFAVVPSTVVRIYKSRAVLTFYEDKARFRERTLTEEEVQDLRRFFADSKVEDLPPLFGSCHHDCGMFEFVRLTRRGGRRFFAYTNFTALIGLQAKLQSLLQSGWVDLRYYLQDKIEGVEILLAQERYELHSVWKNGDDFRVLVKDRLREEEIREEIDAQDKTDEANEDLDYDTRLKRARKRRAEREYEPFEWRVLKDERLGEVTGEPAEVPFLRDKLIFPAAEGFEPNPSTWQSTSGGYEIRAGEFSRGGLWKVSRTEQIEFKSGLYANPVVSGQWVVAAKASGESWTEPHRVVRVNLRTGKEYKINLPAAKEFYPVAYVAAHRKVLLYRGRETDSTAGAAAEFYLLDADTGQFEPVRGEFRPFLGTGFRPPQPTGRADEFWAVIPDRERNETEIGIYDARRFSFRTVLKLPEILLESTDVWVDEKENKVYFIYSGGYGHESHLLGVRLPARTPETKSVGSPPGAAFRLHSGNKGL